MVVVWGTATSGQPRLLDGTPTDTRTKIEGIVDRVIAENQFAVTRDERNRLVQDANDRFNAALVDAYKMSHAFVHRFNLKQAQTALDTQLFQVATVDDLEKPATKEQIGKMRALVTEALEAGAIGVSTGLFYEPSVAAPTEEVIDVCGPLKEFHGVYCTHMRDEADRVAIQLRHAIRSLHLSSVHE